MIAPGELGHIQERVAPSIGAALALAQALPWPAPAELTADVHA